MNSKAGLLLDANAANSLPSEHLGYSEKHSVPIRYLLKLILLALLSSLPAVADTNVAGDEVVIINDNPGTGGFDVGISIGVTPQPDPVLGYLPDADAATAAGSTQEDASDDNVDLWQRIKNGYAMPETQSPFTANHESWYAARPEYVKRMVDRSQKYLYHIVEEVEKRGMPTEIALLPMVESAFNPQAYSRSSASGIWQFMPSTGKNFGLKQSWWVDNRRDVMAATNAALTYLQKLHVMFGTWDLALAAYNAGEGTVQRAINRNRRKGLPTDYESLQLPDETRNYVPKLQAVKNIVSNPEQYGLNVETIPNHPYFTTVTAPQQIDAHLAAQLAEISFDEFSSLNPEYNRPVLTGEGKKHEILLPIGAAETFNTNLANNNKPLVSWQTYHAKRGERMQNIAHKFGISLAQLRDVNDLPVRNNLKSAGALLVPSNKTDADELSVSDNDTAVANSENTNQNVGGNPDRTGKHIVKRGDTLRSVAQHYNMSSKQLMAQNHLKSRHLKSGQVLIVNAGSFKSAGSHAANNSKKTHYLVRRGDTLDAIARKFEVATDDLQRWNNLSGSHIIPGHKLTIIKPDAA